MRQDMIERPIRRASRPTDGEHRLKFEGPGEFHSELRRRVDAHFEAGGRRKRDCWQMYLKSAILFTGLLSSYLLLVFVAQAWWQAAPLAILLALSMVGVGFNIQHDGGHDGYSDRPWVNKLMALSLDLIGGSSYIWRWKHGVYHHTYVNITGHDADIDLGVFGRLSPHQKRLPFHRWQHYYLWPLYGLLAAKWELYDDFRDAISGRIGDRRIQRPRGWDLAVFLGGKALFLTLAFGIPLTRHPLSAVVLAYAGIALILGLIISLVFQLAHAVEEADFPMPGEASGKIENAWAIHQVETTVNFSRDNRMVAWLLGGLNFQIEHHLFPKICHINYPELAKIVERTCHDFGVRYTQHRSFGAGIASHYRWLRFMGMPETV